MPSLTVCREASAMDRRLSFRELRKNASFYLRDKLRQARLALTDVTPAQLLVEEVTSGGPCGPDARTLKMISRAAFEVDDYWRVVDVLHKRLERLIGDRWREWYQALTVLEHLVIHGPDSASREFQCDSDAIRSQAAAFRYVDERAFDWGLAVRKRSERVLKLLERGPLLHDERDRARALTRGIQGFGVGSDGYVGSDEIMSPTEVASGWNSDRTFQFNEPENDSLEECGLGVSKQEEEEEEEPWSCGHRAAQEGEHRKELEWAHELECLRRGNVTFGATCAASASAAADESTPLLAVGE